MELIKLQGEKLSYLPFNRESSIRPRLVDSMRAHGFITAIYCFKRKDKLYILDGQHRYKAALYLGIPYYVAIVPLKTPTKKYLVNLVAKYNNNSLMWKLRTYCEAYEALNVPNYKILIDLSNEFGYTVATVASLMSGTRRAPSTLKDGIFHIHANDLRDTSITLNYLSKLPFKLTNRMVISFHKCRLSNPSFNINSFINMQISELKALKDMKLDNYDSVFNDKYVTNGKV